MTDQTQQSRTETGGFNWERAAACTLCIGAGVLALRLFFRHLLGVLMPFALAYLLARLLRPAVDFLTGGRRRQTASTRAGRRVLSATLVVLFTGLVVWLTVAGVRRGVGELENLLLRLQDVLADGDGQADGAPGFSRALDYIWSVSEHLPFLRRFESTPGFSRFCDWLDGAVRTLVQDLVSRLSGMLSAGAVTLLGSLPSVLLFLTVLLLSCYYFTAEPGGVSRLVAARIPARWRAGLSRWQAGAGRSLRRYLRAALLLALLTFLEMFVGLTLLRKPYAFGVVESLTDPVDGWCDCVIRLDDACPITEKSPIRLRYGFFDPATGANRYAAAEPPIYIDPHHIGIRVRCDAIQPGDAFCTVHTFHARPAILIERAKNVRLTGVTIHSQPGMGIVGNRSENVVLEELSVVPSVGQFWSSNTDATHFTAMKGLLRFYHCHFSHHGDDATNVHGYYQAVVGKCGGNMVLTQEKTPDGTHAQTLDYPDIGDTVEVSRIDSMEVVDTLTVVGCTSLPDAWMCRVTFDHALPEDTDGLILADVTRLPRVEFVDCDVSHHFARSVLLKNRDTLVEDCTFYRAQGPAVVAAAEAYWYEGVCPANLTVRGCRITDCGAWGEAAGIVVKADCDHPAGQTIRNVTITDNEITAHAAHAIFVRNTDGVTIRGNRMHVSDAPVVIEDCTHVTAE